MLAFDCSIFKSGKKQLLIKCVMVLLADVLIALAIVLNKNSGLGNDAVAVFYDGLRALLKVDFGVATNIANISLFIFLCIFAQKFINIGTFLYTIPLGFIVSFMDSIVNNLSIPNLLVFNIAKSTIGCLVLFFGIALFISANIGVDVWTGLSLFLKEKLGKEFRIIKVCVDITLMVLGFLLGGKVGIVTIVAAVLGGPLIQNFTKKTDKFVDIVTKF